MDTSYYEAQGKNLKQYSFLEAEKGRLASKRLENVSNILDYYPQLGLDDDYKSRTRKILNGVYKKHVSSPRGTLVPLGEDKRECK